ncbi:formylglycine-generating enzyme family protein [Tamlana flava]|uniref:formylglycine-generating enzyme family protein n=1 Tax=Tamlana flava TaxID=3158572 RepID=UPI00351B217F
MTQEEALEKLELESGASPQDIKQQYQEFYNEFQLRITNAPTTHQKTLYQKKLKQLEEAYNVLTGQSSESIDNEIPWSSPGDTKPNPKVNNPIKEKTTKSQALELIGLKEPFSYSELDKLFENKKNNFEKRLSEASLDAIKHGYKTALKEITEAYQVLIPFAKEDDIMTSVPPKEQTIPKKEEITHTKLEQLQKKETAAPKDNSKEFNRTSKKSISPILVTVLIVIVIGVALFILKPWQEANDPEIEKQFTEIKAEADLLAKQMNWNEALEKYKTANDLILTLEVQDSIASITKRLELISNKNEINAWETAKSTNTIESYNDYLTNYTEGKYTIEAKTAIDALKNDMSIIKEKNKLDNISAVIKNLEESMVIVKGGTFTMGCNNKQNGCSDDEKPSHQVILDDFTIGKYEVTQEQWKAIMENNPSYHSDCDNCPVEKVSWTNVQNFIRKLNQLTGKHYRLPTEAEWEYAAIGGTKSGDYKYSGSNTLNTIAWYEGNSDNKTHKVGSKQANELGLYDMTGNVSEWCADWYGEIYYTNSPLKNPKGPSSGTARVFRGCNYAYSADSCRITFRDTTNPAWMYEFLGFRLILN